MPSDMDRNNLEVGDWVRVPDTFYPWVMNPTRNQVYGSLCRSAVITRSYMDGIVTIMFEEMREYAHLARGPFTYESQVYADELQRIMTAEEYTEQRGLADVVPYVVGAGGERTPQPRDERGRFTSSNTTERPTVRLNPMDVEAPLIMNDDVNVGLTYRGNDAVMAMWQATIAANTITVSGDNA